MDTIQQYRQKNPQFNGVSDEALGKAVYEQHYADKMPRSEFDSQFGLSQRMNVLEDVGRSIATGAGEAVHAIPGMIGGLFGAGMQLGRGIDKYILGNEVKEPAEVAAANPLQAITPEAFEHYSGFEDIKHQPQTTAGEFARVGANFITPVAPLAASSLIRTGIREGTRPAINTLLKYGAAPAVASETAKRTVKELAPGWEDAAAVLGGLVGGGVMAVISRPSNAALVIRSRMPPGVTNADIMRADAIVREARGRGGTTTWPEALYQATNGRVDVTPLQAIVEQSTGGGPRMAEVMSQRPTQNEAMMTGAMDDLTAGRQRVDPTVAGQTIQRSAKEGIEQLERNINAAARPHYNASANTVVRLPYAIQNNPHFQRALAAVRADPFYGPTVHGLPDHSVGVLDAVKKYLHGEAEEFAARPSGGFPASILRETERDTRGAAVAGSRDYERALGIETDLRQRILNPAEAGPLGALSRTDDIVSQGRQVINRTAEGSEQAVGQTIRLLSQRSPDAAFQLVRTHLRGAFDAAASGTLDQRQGGNFSKAILGNKQEAANLEAAIKALPDGEIRWQAFRSFLEVMEAQSRRRGEGSPTAGRLETQSEMKRGGTVVEGVRIARSLGRRVEDLYDQWKYGKTSGKIADIFTAPGSAGLFKKLASMRTPAGKKAMFGYLLAFHGGQQSGTAQPLDLTVTGELTNPGLKPNRDVSGRVTGFTPGE